MAKFSNISVRAGGTYTNYCVLGVKRNKTLEYIVFVIAAIFQYIKYIAPILKSLLHDSINYNRQGRNFLRLETVLTEVKIIVRQDFFKAETEKCKKEKG